MLEAKPVPLDKAGDITIPIVGFRVGLDPRRGMMPAQIDVLCRVAGKPDGKLELHRRMKVTDWKDLGNGIWVPIKATTTVFCIGKVRQEAGDIATETTIVVDPARSSWNKDVNEK